MSIENSRRRVERYLVASVELWGPAVRVGCCERSPTWGPEWRSAQISTALTRRLRLKHALETNLISDVDDQLSITEIDN
jgi:hypothetical protein